MEYLSVLLKFPVACLAVWRISSLLAQEEGPWGIFHRIRANVTLKSQSLGEGLHCVWCNSLWISPFVAFWVTSDIPSWVILVFALSSGAILIDSLVNYWNRE